jgi:hypothetical protein
MTCGVVLRDACRISRGAVVLRIGPDRTIGAELLPDP